MSKKSKTSCVDCVTDDLMVVRPVSAVSFAVRMLVFLCPGIGTYLLYGYGPYSSQLTWPWLVFLPAAIATTVMFVATDIRRCVLGNLVGSKLFVSVDESGRVHTHQRERSLSYGGGPCVLHMPSGDDMTLAQRDFRGATLEIGTGWLRRCRIHGYPTSYLDSPWKQAKTRGRMLEITDRWDSSFRLPIFSIEADHRWHSVADDCARIILAVLSSSRQSVAEVLRSGTHQDKDQTEVAGKIS